MDHDAGGIVVWRGRVVVALGSIEHLDNVCQAHIFGGQEVLGVQVIALLVLDLSSFFPFERSERLFPNVIEAH